MKAAWVLVAIIASVVAGAGGGYFAVQYMNNNDTGHTNVAAKPLTLDGDKSDTPAADNGDVDKLRTEMQNMQVRIDKAEREKADLKKSIDALNAKLDKATTTAPAAKGADAADGGDGATVETATPNSPEFKEAFRKEYEALKAEEDAARQADRQKRMQDWQASRNKQIVDKLATELSLTEPQKTAIDTVLTDMNTKRAEVMDKGRKAREAGEDFDWQGEMKKVNDDALQAVKDQLSTSQISTLDTLLGDNGSLDALGGGWGGRGGNRGGRRGGGNRGGNGG